MSSQQRLEANRANAKRSTGPKTEPGKVRSKMNAVRHGLSAQAIVIEGEDPRQFEALRVGLERDFAPDTTLAREFVEYLAGILWRLRRVPRLEAEIIKAHTEGIRELLFESEATVGSALMQSDGNDSLHKLSRRETALMNAANRTITMLHMLRVSRVADDARGLIESAVMQPEGNSTALPVRTLGSEG